MDWTFSRRQLADGLPGPRPEPFDQPVDGEPAREGGGPVRGTGSIESLQYLRAIAALLVVGYHAGIRVGDESLFRVGGVGVDIFFVVSGCVMWLSCQRRRFDPAVFIAHRIARIVPLYWSITFVYVLIGLLLPALYPWPELRLSEVLRSLFFLPFRAQSGFVQPVVAPGWTLNLEVFFYLVFAATVVRTQRVRSLYLVLTALAVAGYLLPRGLPAWAWLYTNGMLVEFAGGVFLGQCWLSRPDWFRSRKLAVVLLALACLALLVSQAFRFQPAWSRIPAWGLPAFALVAGLLMLESSGVVLRLPALRRIGDASYSLYLLHTLVLALVYRITGAHFVRLLLVAMPLACAVSYLSYLYLEKPAGSRVLRWLIRLRARFSRGHSHPVWEASSQAPSRREFPRPPSGGLSAPEAARGASRRPG